MELLHCEKLRKQKIELEIAEMDLVSVSDVPHYLCRRSLSLRSRHQSVPVPEVSLFRIFQGEYEFSPEILSGKLAEVVYRDAAGKIQGREFKPLYTRQH